MRVVRYVPVNMRYSPATVCEWRAGMWWVLPVDRERRRKKRHMRMLRQRYRAWKTGLRGRNAELWPTRRRNMGTKRKMGGKGGKKGC